MKILLLADKRDSTDGRNGSQDRSLKAQAEKSRGEGGNRFLNARGSKTEAQVNILKQVQESNMVEENMMEERQKVKKTTMMAPKVPEGITVKQPTTLKQQQTARKQSEVAKKYLEAEQARAKAKEEKANSKARRSPAEKRLHSESNVTGGGGGAAATDDEQPVVPFKRARRSDEARASPRKFELGSPDLSAQRTSCNAATASEFLRLKGRPVNAKGPAKMAPMGKLRFSVKETIGGRKGGAEMMWKYNFYINFHMRFDLSRDISTTPRC